MALISATLAPKPKKPKPASLEDFDTPQHTEGSVQMWVFGDVWIPDWFVLGMGDFRTDAIRTKGGKK